MNLRVLNMLAVCTSVVFCIFCIVPNTYSQSLENQQKALDMISAFADDICDPVAHVGSSTSLELTGNAKIELNNLLKKVVDLGAEGAAKYQDLEYKGVLQKDLASLIQSGARCKENVAKDLIDKLVIGVTPDLSSGNGARDTVVGSSYKVKCTDEKEGNIFDAIIQFNTESKARWRYSNSAQWQNTLSIEHLSDHRLVLTLSNADQSQTAWDLEFSEDLVNVTGWYKFVQRDQAIARWREYSVEGGIIK